MPGSESQDFVNLIQQNKEEEAYQFLYGQYHPLLWKFATGYLKASEPAEELVNDVLYRVWAKKHDVANITNLRIYLFTAVRNSCLTYLAKAKKEREFALELSTKDFSEESPESLLISSELSKHVKDAISALPPRCRQIYELVRIEGLRNKDVAAQLSISVNTIDVQLAIALKRLVKKVNEFQGKNSAKNPLSH